MASGSPQPDFGGSGDAEQLAAGYASLERAEAWLGRFDDTVRRPDATLRDIEALLLRARRAFDRARRLLPEQ